MNPPTKIRTSPATSQESIRTAWGKAVRTLPLNRNKDKVVPLPPQADKIKAVRVLVIPRMTIKGNPEALRKLPEIVRPATRQKMF